MDITATFDKVWKEYITLGMKSPYLEVCEHNALHIASAFNRFAQENNRPPEAFELGRLVLDLGRMGQKRSDGSDGILIYRTPQSVQQPQQQPPQPQIVVQQVAPAAEPEGEPYPNDPNLRNIHTLEDIKEMSADQVRKFMQPVAWEVKDADGTNAKSRFDARVSYIGTNRIKRMPALEQPKEVPLSKEQQRLHDADSRRDAIRSHINSRVLGGNKHSHRTIAFRASLHQKVDDLSKSGASIAQVESAIQAECDSITNGSIR